MRSPRALFVAFQDRLRKAYELPTEASRWQSFWHGLDQALTALLVIVATANFIFVLVIASTDLFLFNLYARDHLLGIPIVWVLAAPLFVLAAVEVKFGGSWVQWWRNDRVPTDADPVRRGIALYGYGMLPFAGILALIAAFAVLTAALRVEGMIAAKPQAATGSFIGISLGYYAWHLLDAVPALDIPKTLNWEAPMKLTGHGGGALLLAFKLAVIIPIAQLIVALIAGWKGRANSS
jgi:hypothetical protein